MQITLNPLNLFPPFYQTKNLSNLIVVEELGVEDELENLFVALVFFLGQPKY